MSDNSERACHHCGEPIPRKPAGKPGPAPKYCGQSCQSKAKHARTYVHKGHPISRSGAQKHKPGNRYGALVLVERVEQGSGEPRALFRCDCGNVKELQINNAARGITTNCADRTNHADPRRKDRLTYDGAHNRTKSQRGSASQYTCGCGNQAEHWAYMHSDPEQTEDSEGREAGRAFSANPAHYFALCRGCHIRWDRARARIAPEGLSLVHMVLWFIRSEGAEEVAA